MPTYYAHRQESGGCDYTIGCGENLIELEATALEDAVQEVEGQMPSCESPASRGSDDDYDDDYDDDNDGLLMGTGGFLSGNAGSWRSRPSMRLTSEISSAGTRPQRWKSPRPRKRLPKGLSTIGSNRSSPTRLNRDVPGGVEDMDGDLT